MYVTFSSVGCCELLFAYTATFTGKGLLLLPPVGTYT